MSVVRKPPRVSNRAWIHLPIHLSVNATALAKGDEEGVIINLGLRRKLIGQREIHRRGRPFGLILQLGESVSRMECRRT